MFSNRYTFIYAAVMVIIVAVLLSVVAIQLKPYQEKNIRTEKMQNILIAVNIESTTKNAEELYNKYITETLVINNKGEVVQGVKAFTVDLATELKKAPEKTNWPVYICTFDNGEKNYIVPVRGKGLWGPVWGYVAFGKDLNTITGSMFDHKSETPGLGAEINTRKFQEQFIKKQIFDTTGKFTSIHIIKPGTKELDIHSVDGISGGTITSNGVADMLQHCLKQYEAYFKKEKK